IDFKKSPPVRPLVILGALSNEIYDEILRRCPGKFKGVVPVTSRSCRGCKQHIYDDYHYISREQFISEIRQNKYIECGQFQNNFYGTRFKKVKEIVQKGHNCIVDIHHHNSIRRLKSIANIHPIVIAVKPSTPAQIM
ncbi:hypothetical protein PFISCL1PPCAC_18514, partial [Pristionchus fissidentatus]